MRYVILFLLSVCFSQTTQSQIYEIGAFAGGTNLIGDVGATNYISPNQPAFGAVFKWNRSPRHAWRASIIYSNIKGEDAKSHDPRRQARNYTFENDLLELSLGMEFNFFDFNLHNPGNKLTPYLYSGISAAKHDNYYFDQTGAYLAEHSSSWALGIPMIAGLKTSISDSFIVALEIGARYTFSDELDGSVPSNSNLKQQYSFGNTNSNDWYVFTGITLTYTFGQKPCYCNL